MVVKHECPMLILQARIIQRPRLAMVQTLWCLTKNKKTSQKNVRHQHDTVHPILSVFNTVSGHLGLTLCLNFLSLSSECCRKPGGYPSPSTPVPHPLGRPKPWCQTNVDRQVNSARSHLSCRWNLHFLAIKNSCPKRNTVVPILFHTQCVET